MRIRRIFTASPLLYAVVPAAAGIPLGLSGWGAAAGLAVWATLQVRRQIQLYEWLERRDDSAPPEATGAWGELLDKLARRQRRALRREASLNATIDRFQQSTAALNDAIVIIDPNNNIEWWNGTADTLLGLRPVDQGKPLLNLLRDPRFVRYYRKSDYHDPLQLKSPLNSDILLQYQINRFGEGDRLLIARDVTRLMKLEQTRQDFVANASHELRTPLTVIRGYLETFLDQELPRPLLRGMSQMQQQTRRMENLVSDLLLLSRLETTQHENDENPVHIQSMARQIQHDAIELSAENEHQVTLDIDPDYDLYGHERELQSAFSNLAFNAIRYTPEHGEIHIRWYVDANGGHFSVTDTGIGIEAHHIPRLTERFYRVDEGRSTASGGTGLGLAIVKHVLMRHGAHLHITSTPGRGSTFSCEFPRERIHQPTSLAQNA